MENGKLKVENLPDGWKKIRLKFLLKEKMQYGAISSGIPFNPELPRYIRITDIKDIKNLFDDDKLSLSEEESKNFLLKDDDVLFARSGATAVKCFMYRKEVGKAGYAGVTSPDYHVFQLHNQNENCSRYYLYKFITEMEKYKQSLIYEYVTGKKQVSSCEFSNENSGKREV